VETVKQFEIWWASLAEPAGRRPVVLLSRNSAYGYLNKFIVAEVTSNVRSIAVEVPLGPAEGLARRCVANLDNIRTVPRSALTKRIGEIAQRRRSEVKRALGFAFDMNELTDVE
jgi:mRNA interferase MazF